MGCGVAAALRPRRFGASRHPISEPGPELEAHAVLGVVVGGLAAGGVGADLEAGVAPEDRTEPSTDAVIACSVIGERKTRVERAGEAPAEEGNAVARLGSKAPCRLEACARRGPARIVRPPRPLRRARRGAQGGDEGEREAADVLSRVEPRRRARPAPGAILDERGIDMAAFKSIPMYRIHASS